MAEIHHSDRKPPHIRSGWVWFAILLGLTIAFYWKLVLTDQYLWFDHPDMAYLEVPRLAFQAREIHAGHFPLWDPHIWVGQSLIGQTQPGPLFPPNLLFALTSLRGGYLRFSHLNAYWVGLHFLAAWFFFLLARDLQLSHQAALMGACVFGFGGFVGSVAWLDVFNGAMWAPLVFLFLLRAARGPVPLTDAAWGGLFLGVAWLSGHHEMPILLSLASGATWIWLCARNRRLAGHAVLFFLIAALISGVQLLPTFEFGRLSRRWIGIGDSLGWKDTVPYLSHTFYSLTPRMILSTVMPAMGTFADTSPYVGWIAGVLAAAGVAARWNQRPVRWAMALLAVSTLYSLGALAPLNGLFYALVPLMQKARIPARGLMLFHLGLALLAAYGADAILSSPLAPVTRRVRNFLLWTGTAIIVAGQLTERLSNDLQILGGLAALVAAAVLTGYRRGALTAPVAVTALVALILTELTSGTPSAYVNRYTKEAGKFVSHLTAHDDIARHLREAERQIGPVRVAIDDQVIGSNFGDWHGIDMYQGYVAGATENLIRHEMHLSRTQDMFSVTHSIGKASDRPGQQLVFTGQSGVNVYRNPSSLPRVRTIHDARRVAGDAGLRVAMQDPAIDLTKTALFLGEPPALESCQGDDRVSLVERGTDKLVIDAELACRGLLIVADTYYPGWKAAVDRRPESVVEAYGAVRGVVVDRGRHRVDLRFRPDSVYYGAAMTASGLILFLAVVLLARRRP